MYEHQLNIHLEDNHLVVYLDGEEIDSRCIAGSGPEAIGDFKWMLYQQYSEYYNLGV